MRQHPQEPSLTDPVARLNAALEGRYRLEREAGAGGMATVYLAEDLRHQRKVALKVLRPDLAASMGPERFLREIGIAAALQHPHILPLYDSGQADGFVFYVMPFVEGSSLRERLAREGALPVPDAVRLLREVADALAEAHRHGVVHRDIKPENVMLSGRHALVTDFGVAKAVSEATGTHTLTSVGMALGTPAYMAPEQATADPTTDHRADIYAFGVLAYELLAGRPPFQQATAQGLIAAHVTTPPERLATHRPMVPPALEHLVMRCLEKRAADRWQTADEIVAELEGLASSGARTPTATAPHQAAARRSPARHAWLALVPLAGLIAWLATRTPALPVDEDVVLALPFRVTATAPEILSLREGVVDILHASLGASVGPRVVAAQTAIGAWRRAGGGGDTDLAADQALALARRLGAGQVLTGSIVQQGTTFVMSGTLAPVGRGRSVQGQVSGPVDSTLVLVGRLVNQLLSLQAGEDAGRASSLEAVPLPALQAFLEGQKAYRAAEWETALAAFGRALAADSTFALAGLYHNMATGWVLTAPPSPGPAVVRANLHRLNDKDRILARMTLNLGGDSTYRDRIAGREAGAGALADRGEAWYLLGDLIFHYGMAAGLPESTMTRRSWAAFNRGLELDPGFGPILRHRFDQELNLWASPDTARLRRLADSFPAIATGDYAFPIAMARGDTAAARSLRERATDEDLFTLSGLTMIYGDVDEAFAILRGRADRAPTQQARMAALQAMRTAALAAGRPLLAASVTTEIAAQFAAPPVFEDFAVVVAALLLDADSTQAAAASARLGAAANAVGSNQPGTPDVMAAFAAGLWSARTGRPADAAAFASTLRGWVPKFQGAQPRHAARVASAVLDLVATPDSAVARARAQALDDLLAPGPIMNPTMMNVANLLVARALAAAGELPRAHAAAHRSNGFDMLAAMPLGREAMALTLAMGDTARVLPVLSMYLHWRRAAEPAQRARDDQLRQELARLVGEPRRGVN